MLLIRFALTSLLKNKLKHLSIFILFTLIVASLFSALLSSHSIKNEINKTLDGTADLIIQNFLAGRSAAIDNNLIQSYETIYGIKSVIARVWGYYEIEALSKKLLIVGLNILDDEASKRLNEVVESFDKATLLNKQVAIVGSGVLDLISRAHLSNKIPFITPNGEFMELDIVGVFGNETALESADLVLTNIDFARKILGYNEQQSTDIAIFVPNQDEVPTIARKIREISPQVRAYHKRDLINHYHNLFDKKSALFIALFFTTIFSFTILLFYKASALSIEDRQEIATLRAVGWSINRVVIYKTLESGYVAVAGFVVGFALSYIYLFWFNAPMLLDLLLGSDNLARTYQLAPAISFESVATIFLLLVPLYVVATILPAWRVAVADIYEALR